MKKKHMIAAILISMALVGCGNRNEETNITTTDQGIGQGYNQSQNADSGDDSAGIDSQKAAAADESGEYSDKKQESGQSEFGKTATDEINAREKSNEAETAQSEDNQTKEGEVADAETVGKITAFGDKSTMNNEVSGRELPIYCVETEENKVALSFDAAWGAEDTGDILEILKKHDIYVTFFATGGWVESYPDDVKAVLAAGHDLGNHSENHKNMSKLSDGEKKEELMGVHQKVKDLTGYEMFLFRPPYGDYDNDVINVAKDCGYYSIQWDVDSLDWKNYGVDSIIETVTGHKNLGNGSIILCHNGAEYTAEALDVLITKIEEQGYEIVPVSELIYRDNFHLNYEGRQIKTE